ncbi:MAG TPA: hypothetical protein VMN39_10310 [Longimicrobiaceae bacterium]|nr:hypothetical protein [Longimicrobiaceae bacterium]
MTERVAPLLLFSLTACDASPTPSDAEVYRMALDAIGAELQLPAPTELHPFPLQLHRSDSTAGFSIGAFNVFDSVAVPSVVARDSSYRLCTLAPEGFCRRDPGGASLVLSEIQDLEQNGLGLVVLVDDERPGGTGHGYYNVRVKGGLGGWSVVELSRVSWDRVPPPVRP